MEEQGWPELCVKKAVATMSRQPPGSVA